MEFIQCPHCQKKYAANDQLRAAVGKKIRCKHCSEGFEIQIQQLSPTLITLESVQEKQVVKTTTNEVHEANIDEPTEPTQASVDQQPLQPEQAEKQAKEKKPNANAAKKEKLNIQLLITIMLFIVLIGGAIGAYLFFNKGTLFSDSPNSKTQSIIPRELIKPMDIKLPTSEVKKTEAMTEQQLVKQAEPQPPQPVQKAQPRAMPEPVQESSENTPLSQVCKDISADYWVRSHTLATTSMDTATYMKLLNQNLEQANEIRKLCKDKRLIGKIAKAARVNQKPTWIAAEIALRIHSPQQ